MRGRDQRTPTASAAASSFFQCNQLDAALWKVRRGSGNLAVHSQVEILCTHLRRASLIVARISCNDAKCCAVPRAPLEIVKAGPVRKAFEL